MSKIATPLKALTVPISSLSTLEGNPRQGNIPALAKSLDRFGQLKPVVYQTRGKKRTVIAGNHTLAAAQSLGWEEIAAVDADSLTEEEANAFALADNRISDLGMFNDAELGEFLRNAAIVDDSLLEAAAFNQEQISRLMSTITDTQFDGLLTDMIGEDNASWGSEMELPPQADRGLVSLQVMMEPDARKQVMLRLKELVDSGSYESTGEALAGIVLND